MFAKCFIDLNKIVSDDEIHVSGTIIHSYKTALAREFMCLLWDYYRRCYAKFLLINSDILTGFQLPKPQIPDRKKSYTWDIF